MYWPNIVFAVLLWIIFVPVLAKLARYEPHASGILVKNLRYTDVSLSATGKPGASKLVRHKRWS